MWFAVFMRLPPLKLRRGDRSILESFVRSGTVEARTAKRARIVLLAADGVSNREIATLVDLHYNQVGLWRSRYAEYGLAGLDDEERSGRRPTYDHDNVLLLVKTVTEPQTCAGKPQPARERGGLVGGREVGHAGQEPGQPALPAIPGTPARREFEYRRHGTAVLFAGLDVHRGDVAGWVTDSTRSENFVDFLADLVAQTPDGLDLHCIVDNLATHSTDGVARFLEANPHVHLHFTPTYASWLNQVELFFSILERRLLRRGEFASVDELAERVMAFIKDYNRRAAPFRWTYDGRPLKVA